MWAASLVKGCVGGSDLRNTAVLYFPCQVFCPHSFECATQQSVSAIFLNDLKTENWLTSILLHPSLQMLLPKLSAQSTGNKKGVVAFTPNMVSHPKKNLTPFCKYTQNSLPFPEPLDGPHWRLLSFSLDPQKLSFAALGSSSTSAMWGSLQTPDGPHQPPFLGNHFRGRGIPTGKSRGNTSGCASGTEAKTLGKAAVLQRVTIWDHD